MTVVDDRPEYASRERFPEADRVVAAPIAEALRSLPIGQQDGDRGGDAEPRPRLRGDGQRAPHAARYVGLMGARRKAILVTERLVAEGFRSSASARSGRRSDSTSARARRREIAVSILAEWLMVRQGGTGSAHAPRRAAFEKAAGRGAST